MNEFKCYVHRCRYPWTHITSGHQCGKCSQLGHGLTECDDEHKKLALRNTYGSQTIPLEKQCSIPSCKKKELHTTHGHICSVCSKFSHECTGSLRPNQIPESLCLNCPICRTSASVARGKLCIDCKQ